MVMSRFLAKLKKRWTRLWIKPVHVFCFHQVSDEFEPDTMNEGDWMQTESFKRSVSSLKKKYVFVSIQEAYNHVANDRCRLKHYAVLTADDGWASLKSILPWLDEQEIPITLLLNPLYLDGKHFRERETERYLSEDDIRSICSTYANVSIGMHGWEHVVASKQSEDEFRKNVELSMQALKNYETFVPYFAFPWGRCNRMNVRVLKEYNLIPVLMDGLANYDDASQIHRELLTVETK